MEEPDKLKQQLSEERSLRRELEQLLREKNAELDALRQTTSKNESAYAFAGLPDAYVLMNLSGLVIHMNEAAIDLLGFDYREEEVNLMSLVEQEYLSYTQNCFQLLYDTGSYVNYKAAIRTKKHGRRMVQINASVIYNAEGKPIAAHGITRDVTEEVILQQQLTEQKQRLDIIINHSPVGISLSKLSAGGIIVCNQAMLEILGYTLEELNQLDPGIFTHPDDRDWSLEYLQKLRNGDINTYTIEKRYLTKAGKTVWAKTSASAVRDENGKLLYQVAIIEDISQEKEAKEKLRESENRLSALIVNLQSGVLLEDENRKILLTNRQFCDMFSIDITPEEMIGIDCTYSDELYRHFFLNPDEFFSGVNTLIEKKKPSIGAIVPLKDGRIFERNFTPIYDGKTYKGHLWTYHDVTIQHKYKDSLQIQKEKYGSIIAHMNLGLLEVDNNDNILMANQSFCELSGYQREELIGRKAADLFIPTESSEVFDQQRDKRNKGISDSYELKTINKAGEPRYWLISGAPNYDLNGNIIGSIGVHLDITEIRVLQEQKEQLLRSLEAQNEKLNEYAHVVSHDLKSPLRSITALINWTKEDFRGRLGEESLLHLNLIEEKIESMDHLIEGILTYSGIESDLLVADTVEIEELIEHIKHMIYIPDHVTVEAVSDLPVILVDRTRIQQVFQNLISNAVNYIEKDNGHVQIAYLDNPEFHIFSVQDNGVGIAKEHHEKVFEIFKSLSNHKYSTGIGLNIVKKIVDLYDGKVWLESTIGEGTTFYFSIKKQE